MANYSIKIKNLSKRYRINLKNETKDTFIGAIGSMIMSPYNNLKRIRNLTQVNEKSNNYKDIIWALNNLTLNIEQGEVLGIIGSNGAGKSTLLKILSRITFPTYGSVDLYGRVASLLEVGTGFHPELTGRENIYLNGTILGMSKNEIDSKLEEMIDFSGVELFIDTPVKRYSSGMRVRLAFSVAAHLNPDILLIDEVLAVGDANFQKKCLGKMDDVAKGGKTVLFVSHNLVAMKNICTSGVCIDEGKLAIQSSIDEVLAFYRNKILSHDNINENKKINISKDGTVKIKKFKLKSSDPSGYFVSGCSLRLIIKIESENILKNCYLNIGFIDENHEIKFIANSLIQTNEYFDIDRKRNLILNIKDLPLTDGEYFYHIKLTSDNETKIKIMYCEKFSVYAGDFFKSGRILNVKEGMLVNSKWDFG